MKEIENFCWKLFTKTDPRLTYFINGYKDKLRINIPALNIKTERCFKDSFKSISEYLFKDRPAIIAYIIPLLVFALNADEYYSKPLHPWYHIGISVALQINILESINFHPADIYSWIKCK